MREWQPIETAPKDGTMIDVWNRGYGRRIPNVCWREQDKGITGEMGWALSAGTCGPDDFFERWQYLEVEDVTHWMPLPEPPK